MQRLLTVSVIFSGLCFAQTTLGTVTYQEQLGVAAPEQNIRFSKLDSGASIPTGLSYRNNRVLNAAGIEVPWQQMSNGDLMVHTTGVPASKFPVAGETVLVQPTYLRTGTACFAVNTAAMPIPSVGGVLPSPLVSGTVYYVASCALVGGYYQTQLSATFGGAAITSYSGGSGSFFLESVPFVASGDTFTSLAHGYSNGTLLRFAITDAGALNGGLTAGANYFVCNSASNTFKVSTTADCTNIVTTTTAATGVPAIYATVSWTLQSGAATTASATNGPVVNIVGNNLELTNGLTGIRIPTAAYEAANSYAVAPIQGLKLADGTWTPSNGNIKFDNGVSTVSGSTAATGYTLTTIESGLLEVSVKASTTANRVTVAAGGSSAATDTTTNSLSFVNFPNQSIPPVIYIYSGGTTGLTTGQLYYTLAQWPGSGKSQVAATPGGTPIALSAGTANVGGVSQEPGTGYYNLTATLDANSKLVQAVEDHNIHNYSYSVNTRPNLVADTARYRGWRSPINAGATIASNCGYLQRTITGVSLSGTTLTITAPNHQLTGTPNIQLGGTTGIANANDTTMVATVVDANTLTASCPTCTGTSATGGFLRTDQIPSAYLAEFDLYIDLLKMDRNSGYTCYTASSPGLMAWLGSFYPANDSNTGRYWFMYNSSDSSTGNSIGITLGDGSKESYGEVAHGPGVFDKPSTSTQGFTMSDSGQAADAKFWSGEKVKSWAFWISTKADVADPFQYPSSIDLARNAVFGINISRLMSYSLSFPDPAGGWTYPFSSDSNITTVKSLLSNGTPLCGSSSCLSGLVANWATTGPISKYLLDDSAPQSTSAFQGLTTKLNQYGTAWQNGDGPFDHTLHYYQALYPCTGNTTTALLVLKSASASAWQKSRAKAFLGLCGGIAWDPRLYPYTDPSLAGGLANQQGQFAQEQAEIAVQQPSNPSMASVTSAASNTIVAGLLGAISSSGASYASWHYQAAATEQALFDFMALQKSGTVSASSYPQLSLFGQWYLSCLTPPEVRFGTTPTRMCFSNGDGNTEPETSIGLIGSVLTAANSTVAANLGWAWNSQGPLNAISEMFSPALMALNLTPIETDPQLKSQHYPGYHSVLRSGWGTSYENAVDFLYGGVYSGQGHAHADTGRTAMYLLGAPVSIDWNANLYNPETPGRMWHSSICLDSELTSPAATWSQDNMPTTACDTQFTGSSPDKTTLLHTSTFTGSSSATASWAKSDGTVWQRSVQLFNYDPNFAVVHQVDTFTGAQAAGAKTLTQNLMAADGAVTTPSGSYTPIVRTNTGNNGVLVSNGPVNTLVGNGIQKFAFTGASWAHHASGGVDFDLYTQNADTQQWLIGNWCTDQEDPLGSATTCPSQKQDVLRLYGTGGFDTWIVARKKGAGDPTVSAGSCGTGSVHVALAGTLCFDAHHSEYDDGAGTQSVAVYDTTSETAFGMTISGGPAEAVKTAAGITVTIHGYAGSVRTITLPAGYYPQQPTVVDNSGNVLVYGESQSATLSFTSTAQAQRNVSFPAPAGGANAKLKFAASVAASTPYLANAAPGSTVIVKAAPGVYQAQWVMDGGQSQVFAVTIQ